MRVLLVEDEPGMAQLICQGLERNQLCGGCGCVAKTI